MSGPTTVCPGNVGVSPNTSRQNSVGFQDDIRDDEERRKYLTAKLVDLDLEILIWTLDLFSSFVFVLSRSKSSVSSCSSGRDRNN